MQSEISLEKEIFREEIKKVVKFNRQQDQECVGEWDRVSAGPSITDPVLNQQTIDLVPN